MGLATGDLLLVQEDLARAHLALTEHGLQERRLAGTVRSDDAHELAGRDLEIATVEDVDLGDVTGDEISGVQNLGHAPSSRSDRP